MFQFVRTLGANWVNFGVWRMTAINLGHNSIMTNNSLVLNNLTNCFLIHDNPFGVAIAKELRVPPYMSRCTLEV